MNETGRAWGCGRRSRRRLTLLACCAALGLCSGCGAPLAGHWQMVKALPNRQFFCIDDVTLGRDGSYSATTTLKGRTLEESGQYRFNGFKLTFAPQAGGRRQYDALLKLNELEIIDGKQKVILRKD